MTVSGVPSLAFHVLNKQGVEANEFCNAQCSSFSGCEFFRVNEGNFCIITGRPFDESSLFSDSSTVVGVPCCPARGYVTYNGKSISNFDLHLDTLVLEQDEGGDKCNAECSLRRECGYFHVVDNTCVMFRGPFHQRLLMSDAPVFVGVPCGIENPTEDPNEAPTEASTPTREERERERQERERERQERERERQERERERQEREREREEREREKGKREREKGSRWRPQDLQLLPMDAQPMAILYFLKALSVRRVHSLSILSLT